MLSLKRRQRAYRTITGPERDGLIATIRNPMRRPSTISPPVGRFADVLLTIDLPELPDDRRERRRSTFIEQRVTTLPSFTRFGVVVISFAVELIGRVVGLDRAADARHGQATPPPRRVPAARPLARLRVHLGDLAATTDEPP